MQGNADNCRDLISTGQKVHINKGTIQIKNSNGEKLLEIHIDSKLGYKKYIRKLGRKKVH